MNFLDKNLIAFNVEVNTPQEAIEAAGNLLVCANYVEEKYVNAMIESYNVNGAYIVIAPAIAIPHARPEDGVKETSISLAQLKKPIVFGNEANDPVYLVFAIGASNSDKHLEMLKRLSNILDRKQAITQDRKSVVYVMNENYK